MRTLATGLVHRPFRGVLHELTQARKVNSHAPAYTRCLELPAGYVPPQCGVREAAVPLGFWVTNPLLLYGFR
jgi:hypothetical protein